MIIKILPICPPSVRPSISVNGGVMRSEDDLTFQYCSILKANNLLNSKNDNAYHLQEQAWIHLQYSVNCLFDNSVPGLPKAKHTSGKKIKSISERLKGKEGRIRGNLMGKRVDFSARSVISPDPSLQLNELGVPLSIAKHLTFPEIVNNRNKE